MLLAVFVASAQTPSQKSDPVQIAVPQTGKYSVTTTRMGVLLADPDAKAVLVDSQDLQQATSMSLKDMQMALQTFAPDLLSDKVLAQIQTDFNNLPSKK
jgi:hypothetical protein